MASRRKSKRKTAFRWSIVLGIILFLVVFRLVEEVGHDRLPTDRFIVKRVLDGDTFELAGGDRVRLLSIDTPEKGEPLHGEACQLLSKLTLGKPVRLEYAGRRRDKYGRLLGYVYVDSVFVNKIILENGLGYLYLFRDTPLNSPETKTLLDAQRRAMAAKVGLWALPHSPEEYYIVLEGSFRFHRPGCQSVSKRKPGHFRTFSTREEALYEGLSPCRRCKP